MRDLQIHIKVSEELFLKNPDSSEIGRKIISNSITLIWELGFEQFTFKKLGERIGSPESSIYRYFENKKSLLIYLVSWCWSLVHYKLIHAITNVYALYQRLKRAITVFIEPVKVDHSFSYIDEGMHQQYYFAEYLSSLTDVNKDSDAISIFHNKLVFSFIQ